MPESQSGQPRALADRGQKRASKLRAHSKLDKTKVKTHEEILDALGAPVFKEVDPVTAVVAPDKKK